MSDEVKIFNNGVEFVDFLNNNHDLKMYLEAKFEAFTANISAMRESLNKRPCSCGGVNPDAVLAERRANLENFYRAWITSISGEQLDSLKSALGPKIILNSAEQKLLET